MVKKGKIFDSISLMALKGDSQIAFIMKKLILIVVLTSK